MRAQQDMQQRHRIQQRQLELQSQAQQQAASQFMAQLGFQRDQAAQQQNQFNSSALARKTEADTQRAFVSDQSVEERAFRQLMTELGFDQQTALADKQDALRRDLADQSAMNQFSLAQRGEDFRERMFDRETDRGKEMFGLQAALQKELQRLGADSAFGLQEDRLLFQEEQGKLNREAQATLQKTQADAAWERQMAEQFFRSSEAEQDRTLRKNMQTVTTGQQALSQAAGQSHAETMFGKRDQARAAESSRRADAARAAEVQQFVSQVTNPIQAALLTGKPITPEMISGATGAANARGSKERAALNNALGRLLEQYESQRRDQLFPPDQTTFQKVSSGLLSPSQWAETPGPLGSFYNMFADTREQALKKELDKLRRAAR